MVPIIKDKDLKRVGNSVKPDSKRRIVLPVNPIPDDITYHVYINTIGQIVLDPQVTIPASEAWLFNNPDILKSARQGLADIAEGRVSRIDLNTL